MRKRAVGVIIKDNKILLIHRLKNEREYFVFPGGGVEEKETPKNTIFREIKEELNLDIKVEKLLFQIKNQNREEFYFLIKDFSGKLKISGEEKEKMNKNNQYKPIWKNLEEIKNLSNLYPLKVKEKIFNF